MTDPKPDKSLFAKTAGGVFWTGFGTGSQTFIQFAVLIVLARLLTPEEFGIVAAAMVVVGLSTIFSLLGVGPAIVQRSALEKRHIRTAFSMSLVLGVFFYGVIWTTAPYIEDFFRMSGFTEILRVLALVFPIKSLGVVSESLAQRDLNFKFLAAVTLVSYAIGYGGIAITFALIGFGPFSLVLAYLGQATIMTILLLFGRSHSFLPAIEFRAFLDLMHFGSGFTIAQIGNYSATQGDNLVVGRLIGAEGLGEYGRAYQLMGVPATLVGTVMNKVLFPSFSTIQHDVSRLMRSYRRAVSTVAILILPVSLFMVIFAEELILLILGDQWGGVVLPLQILAAGLLFRTGYKTSDSLAKATGSVYRRAWRHWAYAGAIVLFAAAGTMWSLPGVALGVTVAITLNYALMADLSCKVSGLSWSSFIRAHLPGMALAGVCLPLMVGGKWLLLSPIGGIGSLLVVGVGTCLFIALLWKLAPKVFLGQEGIWFIRKLTHFICSNRK